MKKYFNIFNLFLRGELEVFKKAIISGIVFSSILLVGCNGEEVIDITEDANLFSESELKEFNLISELQNEIMADLDSESIGAIMIDGNPFKEMIVSVSFPKDVKVDHTMIQQIVKDSIKNVYETGNVAISEENITIKIEKY